MQRRKDVGNKLDFDLKEFEEAAATEEMEVLGTKQNAVKLQPTTTKPPLSTRETTPTRSSARRQTEIVSSTAAPTSTIFAPGCEIDAVLIIDSSGSVEETFSREKELAAGIIHRLRIGPNNARVAIIKFAAKEKVKTVWSFDQPQVREKVLEALDGITFSSGTTAIHSALLQVCTAALLLDYCALLFVA
ncbi:unnamed protein product [Gongylonema pulchrum]|uniref:VWFA domain-containing protein n=1 Tax=Gongylonema pulchrum TaxID=637853 RepID=A0A3P7NGW5_9BILA|nr:unnamed protein product [Gongylonema pulchrum]